MKTIAMRKSTRNYKSEQINDESLNTILTAGCAAPVGMILLLSQSGEGSLTHEDGHS